MHRIAVITFGLFAAATAVGYAHHPYRSLDVAHPITITGEIVNVTYAEPHSYIKIGNRAAGGRTVIWVAELRGISQLRARGITPQTLKPGEQITVTGSPGRAGDKWLRATTLVRLRDRFTWSGV